ncbi:hypothetical protein Tco_1232824, partial [Tanacetum coccineum]
IFDVIKEPEAPEEAPPSPDYVPGPEHPPSPDYVHGPQHPPSPDPEEDPEEDPANYPADGGDDADDESSDDDDDDGDEEDKEEEEEHSASVDSFAIPVDDHVPSVEDTKAFETYESASTPVPSPRRRTARISVRPQTLMLATAEALIIPSPPLLVPSPPLPLPPPTVDSPTYDEAPLGYKADGIRLRAASPLTHHPSEIPSPPLLLLSTSHRDDIHEADLPPRKRLCLTAPTHRFEVGESSSAAAVRQAERPMSREVDYGITNTWDELVDTI